ncbi:alkaline phosphatase [Rubripirellula reticaptiva]|uniref:Alkaline phosphatase H n=1 Tax=Rubripirellula reticaptiva TaxID=2528013 RepID=A0A5C6F894_9BACT|nr:alkaline phosphatase [Rubripirellula reticaptiva]TWU57963.1 Alkaline phosphatase H precursor [Rubripirellula reticaptiva]
MIRVASLTVMYLVFYAADLHGQETTVSEKPKQAEQEAQVNTADYLREMQSNAVREQQASWGHWGNQADRFSTWLNHSNRLIPVYTFGITLDSLRAEGSAYADPARLENLYGSVPEGSVNSTATYFDQTDVYQLQKSAIDAGFTNIIMIVFDGMDWQTTRAAALYQQHRNAYSSGRGTGLSIQDERSMPTDFGLIVTSARNGGAKYDVNSQTMLSGDKPATGGFDSTRGGDAPWNEKPALDYLMGLDRERPHTVTDSAASATSLFSGIKTYNGSINVAIDGTQVEPLARALQANDDYMVGIVTSVPVSHATPAAAYANNVARGDYQDISRDLIGLPSSAHRNKPLPGVDVLIGGGWGEGVDKDSTQGDNFATGNKYLHQDDLRRVNIDHGGPYVVAQRTKGKRGRENLMAAAQQAADDGSRLLGYFGGQGGHLPFQTADGNFDPTFDAKGTEKYSRADIDENPTLADMTEAALLVLEQSIEGFWLLIEAGDVDWANHANNLDNAIGAVASGDAAFRSVMNWIDENNAADFTAVIVTSDHGHYLVIDDIERIVKPAE